MAWSFADLDSDYQTWLSEDRPMAVVQKIPVSPSYAKWVDDGQVSGGDITTWTDRSATDNPALRAYDGLPGLVTKQSGTSEDVWYFALDLGSTYAFDSVFVIGHNFGTLGSTTVTLEIADDNDFGTSLTEIASFGTPSSDSRLQELSLAHGADGGRAHDTGADSGPNVYTAQYIWLKIDKTGTNITPEIGELILGTRYQFKTNPVNPYDDLRLHDEISRVTTQGGVTHTTTYYQNQFVLNAQFSLWEDARITDAKNWFVNARGSFVWIPEPSTAPGSWYLLNKPSDLDMPSSGYTERKITISGEEQGPESFFLENES